MLEGVTSESFKSILETTATIESYLGPHNVTNCYIMLPVNEDG